MRILDGPHVAREAATVQFEPTVIANFDSISSGVAKIVGVSDDHDSGRVGGEGAHDEFGDQVSAARSQPYYLDVTHPGANKGERRRASCPRSSAIPAEQIATIGDMPNDVLMFAHCGLSIAMGNATGRYSVPRAA